MERVTQHPTANDQLLYFTSPSLTADGRTLVFLSDRGGHVNLWSHDLATGSEQQLSDNHDGYLHSYVYFDGQQQRGLGKASVCLDPVRRRVFYLQGHRIMRVNLDDPKPVAIAEIPSDQVTAFTHVSSDGSRLCVPTTDIRALEGFPGDFQIDDRVQTEGLNSYLRAFDTETGQQVLCERVHKAWITHVQYRPGSNEQILYNHEWPADVGIRRMWLWNGSTHQRLRTEEAGRSRKDWTCHEMWTRDGSTVIYHGSFENGPAYIGKVVPEEGANIEIALDKSFKRYGHFTVGKGSTLVSDGYYFPPADDDAKEPGHGGRYIATVTPDWNSRTLTWRMLCKHGSSWKSQDEHPHPVFDAACDWVYFTSDTDGRRAVWRVRAKN